MENQGEVNGDLHNTEDNFNNTNPVNSVNNARQGAEQSDNIPNGAGAESVEDDNTIRPEDSASNVSKSSTTSHMRSIRRQIELNYELVALREANALKEEQCELRRRAEDLARRQKEIKLRAKLQAAKEINVTYENLCGKKLNNSDSEVTFKTVNSNIQARVNSSNIPVPKSDQPVTCWVSETHEGESLKEKENADLISVFNKLLENQKDQNLPTQDIKPFDGTDVLQYQTFVKNFEYVVERNTADPARRLEFLLKYTKGEAHDLIRFCPLIEPPKRGYEQATYLLKRDYGDPPLIASAFASKAEHWPRIQSGDKLGLRKFSIFLINCVNSKQNNREMETMDGGYVEVGKLRERELRSATLSDFEQFVGLLSRNENDPRISGLGYQHKTDRSHQPNTTHSYRNNSGASKRVLATEVKENLAEKPPCLYCGANTQHSLHVCRKFAALSAGQKSECVRRKGLCFGCLNPGHLKINCVNPEWAHCERCTRQHATALHDPRKDGIENHQSQSVSSGCALMFNTNKTKAEIASNGEPLMSVAPVRVRSKMTGESLTTYAFVDNGSSSGFLTPELQTVMKIRCKTVNVNLKTLTSEKVMKMEQTLDSFEITDFYGGSYIDLPASYVQKEMPVTISDAPTRIDLDKYEHLKRIPIPDIKDIDIPRVSLMIGINVPSASTPLEVATGKVGEPYGIRSPIGWLFYGFKGKLSQKVNRINFCHVDANLDNQVKYYFNLEFSERLSDSKLGLSSEDKQFLKIMDESVVLKDGHYQTKLPFRDPSECVPNNKIQAEMYAYRLKKRLMTNVELLEHYTVFMNKLEKNNFCEKVPDSDLNRNDGRTWYIPQHPVQNLRKSNRVRVVFNCPVSYQNGKSLNDLLLQGPDLTNLLLGVLLRWRQERIALMSDIECMFYQVHVEKSDCDMLRFLWWPSGDLNKPLTEYRMLVHLFGAVSSPSCANYALRKVGTDFKSEYRNEVLECVEKDFYVDDFLKSLPTVEESVNLVNELCHLLARAGFNLTKWVSNSKELLKVIPMNRVEEDIKSLDLDKDRLPVKRALGVTWSVENDTINFTVNTQDLNTKATKRNILSVMSSVYDPFGIASPFVLKAKVILQELCRKKLSWDEPIPEIHRVEWNQWLMDLDNLKNVKIDRCIKPLNFGTVTNTQLHHFADASQSGYGSVTYVRLENEHGEMYCSFLIGRSRVAPIKPMTIVKLELSAATALVRINNLLERELTVPVNEIYFWTDSQTVIKYIRNETTRHPIFVANRLAVIHDGSNVEQWRYIPSLLNPADHASRGLRVNELLTENWLIPPEFLSRPSEWPENLSQEKSKEENEETVNVTKIPENQLETMSRIFNQYSDWVKLKRAVCWWIRLRKILQLKSKRSDIPDFLMNKHLSADEINNSESVILKYVQSEHFSSEIRDLDSKQTVKGSNISNLDPFLGEDGLLKVGGRLRNAKIPENAKHQVILPKDCHLTRLIVRNVHKRIHHQGINHTLAEIRQNFWIIKGGILVKGLVKNCVICRKYQKQPGEQKMADLPAFRVTPDEPAFSKVGMDYFGPFPVKCGRKINKHYGILFTCMSCRAIHLEVGESLDTSSCINAIRRFIARRGLMTDLYSDNGTNLVGAKNELKSALKELSETEMNNFGIKTGFQWHFNPPAASHHGGVWERQIRTVRKVLNAILNEQYIKTSQSYEQLLTFLCETESIVNSRPLVKTSDDVNDLNVITPNSLLLLRPTTTIPCGVFVPKDMYVRRRWRQMQYLSELFWKRWTREYLPFLQQRQKWLKPRRDYCEGDVVLLVDENLPRGSWLLGLVTEIYKDKHDNVRSVKLRTQSSTLIRPISKLCLILENENGEIL